MPLAPEDVSRPFAPSFESHAGLGSATPLIVGQPQHFLLAPLALVAPPLPPFLVIVVPTPITLLPPLAFHFRGLPSSHRFVLIFLSSHYCQVSPRPFSPVCTHSGDHLSPPLLFF